MRYRHYTSNSTRCGESWQKTRAELKGKKKKASNMKCEICGKKIETTFLNKIVGTRIRDAKGKKKLVCSECQKKYTTTEMRKAL